MCGGVMTERTCVTLGSRTDGWSEPSIARRGERESVRENKTERYSDCNQNTKGGEG